MFRHANDSINDNRFFFEEEVVHGHLVFIGMRDPPSGWCRKQLVRFGGGRRAWMLKMTI